MSKRRAPSEPLARDADLKRVPDDSAPPVVRQPETKLVRNIRERLDGTRPARPSQSRRPGALLTREQLATRLCAPRPFYGLTLVLTGCFEPHGERGEIEHALERLGARCTGSVSGNTDLLVYAPLLEDGRGCAEGRKYRAAEERGTLMLSQAELDALLREHAGHSFAEIVAAALGGVRGSSSAGDARGAAARSPPALRETLQDPRGEEAETNAESPGLHSARAAGESSSESGAAVGALPAAVCAPPLPSRAQGEDGCVQSPQSQQN